LNGAYDRSVSGIIVDFNRPMPIFPLAGVVLLPHAVQPLHIFERRYRQMVAHCLGEAEQGGGQIALASFAAREPGGAWGHKAVDGSHRPAATSDSSLSHWTSDSSGMGALDAESLAGAVRRHLRPTVCVGHILRHEELPDHRYNILLQGVCRARILEVEEPDSDRLYHQARLRPVGVESISEESYSYVRTTLRAMLRGPQLRRMSNAGAVMEWIRRVEVPTSAVVEIASFALIFDEEIRYQLLEEPSLEARVKLLREELARLACLVRRGDRQSWRAWPKGASWN
jgi:hypothetical protein